MLKENGLYSKCEDILRVSEYYTLSMSNALQSPPLKKIYNFNLFISPPFSNYQSILSSIYNIPENSIFIKGSYTLEPRNGLWMQVIKTLRYSFTAGGWVNKIGLRNPGIDEAIKQNYMNLSKTERTKVITSIAILNTNEIKQFEKKIPYDMNLEINISCPNVNQNLVSSGISHFINSNRKWCIIKLSPICSLGMIDTLYQQGFRQFHCSNTLPIANGGLSGPSLIPYTTNLVSYISTKYPDCKIIAGGGIRTTEDIEYYKKIGAHHFSVSTLFFNPWMCYKFFGW